MNKLLNYKNKVDMLSYGYLHLYMYLACAYSKFLMSGKALGFPLLIQVQTQSFCNGQCSVCPYPLVSQNLPQGRMEWELFTKIADESAAEPLLSTFVCMLQNEPLLDKRILDCVKYFKSISKYKRSKIVTNGELLDRYSLPDIIQSHLDILTVSLNAQSKDVYREINQGLDYDRVVANISALLSNETTKRKLTIGFLNTKFNPLEINAALPYWRKKGVKTRVIDVSNRAGSLDGYEKFRPEKKYQGNGYLSKLRLRSIWSLKPRVGCSLPFHQMNILFNGDVIVCCQDWNRDTVVGNVHNSSLKEIWNSEKMNQIRRSIMRKRYNEVKSCQACSLAR